jgi:hypothetical protein
MLGQKTSKKSGLQTSEFKVSCDKSVSGFTVSLSPRPSLSPNLDRAKESRRSSTARYFFLRYLFQSRFGFYILAPWSARLASGSLSPISYCEMLLICQQYSFTIVAIRLIWLTVV